MYVCVVKFEFMDSSMVEDSTGSNMKLNCCKLEIMNWNAAIGTHKTYEFMYHEEVVTFLRAVDVDKISDSLGARVKYDKSKDRFETDADVTVGEEDEVKHGKVVEVVECDSLEYYNHKRCPVQPRRVEMEGATCAESPPRKERGSDLVWDLGISMLKRFVAALEAEILAIQE
jgi:hypothetical protein